MHPGRLNPQAVAVDNAENGVGVTRRPIELATKSMRLQTLNRVPEDLDLRRQWNALVFAVDQPQVFYTYEWALAVQNAYSASLLPLLFLAYDSSETLRGVAALAMDSARKRVSFLCATTGDYCDFVSLPEDKSAFVSGVLAELRKQGIEDLVLTNLPADSDSVTALRRASAENRYHCFRRTAYECAQVWFSRLEHAKDGKPVAPGKSRIRRFAKSIAGEGTVKFDHSRSWNSVAPILPRFIRAHIIRFLETGRISILADERRRLFLTDLSKLLSESEWLVLSRMIVGERVYAWQYGFQFHDNWFCYQPTFDSSVEKRWPGFCLLTQVIQDAAENPALTRLELGLGPEAYKAKFANATRRTMYLTLHRSLRKHSQEFVRYRMTAAIARWPRAEHSARRLAEKVKAVKRRAKESGLQETFLWLLSRVTGRIFSREAVLFFESDSVPNPQVKADSLRPITYDLLAVAAMRYCDDDQTLQYLLRSAARLRRGDAEGFALVGPDGTPLHFAWGAEFDGFFFAELNTTVGAPAPDCVILFDCWTPVAFRGRGYYGQTVDLLAQLFQERGKKPWIFCAKRNAASLRGLANTRFQRRYSLVRWRFLGRQIIQGKSPRVEAMPSPPTLANARAKRA